LGYYIYYLLLYVFSGVARVPCALGQEIFLRPRQQKLQRLKLKKVRKCGRSKNRTFSVVILSVFEGNKTHLELEMNSTRL